MPIDIGSMGNLLMHAERLKGCVWGEGIPKRGGVPGYDIPYTDPPFGTDTTLCQKTKNLSFS